MAGIGENKQEIREAERFFLIFSQGWAPTSLIFIGHLKSEIGI